MNALHKHSLTIFLMAAALPIYGQIDAARGGTVHEYELRQRYSVQSSDSTNVQVVGDPAGSSKLVLQVDVKSHDQKVFGGLRAEVVPRDEYVRTGIRWYAISAYFPDSWFINPSPAIFGQLHTSQKSVPLSPPLSLIADRSNVYVELYANHRPISAENGATKLNSARQRFRLTRLVSKTWFCFVIKADWSAQLGAGEVKIWMNGERVYESENLYNSYETWLGNYPKTGLYFPGGIIAADKTIYVDFIHIGGARTSASELLSKTPCAN